HFQEKLSFVGSGVFWMVSLALPGVNGSRHPPSGVAGQVDGGRDVDVVVPRTVVEVDVVVARMLLEVDVVVARVVLEVDVVVARTVLEVDVVVATMVLEVDVVVATMVLEVDVVVATMVVDVVVVVAPPVGASTTRVTMLGLRTLGTPDPGAVWNS